MEARLKRHDAQVFPRLGPRLHSVRGTTLVELLTAMTLFLLMIGTIMTFYIQGARLNRQQDQRLELMRRSLRILDRLEVLLSRSRVLWMETSNDDSFPVLLFCPLNGTKPLTASGANWSTKASQLCLIPNQNKVEIVHLDSAGQRRIIGTLVQGETINIAYSNEYLKITLNLLYYPDQHAATQNVTHHSTTTTTPTPASQPNYQSGNNSSNHPANGYPNSLSSTANPSVSSSSSATSESSDSGLYTQTRIIPICNYEEY